MIDACYNAEEEDAAEAATAAVATVVVAATTMMEVIMEAAAMAATIVTAMITEAAMLYPASVAHFTSIVSIEGKPIRSVSRMANPSQPSLSKEIGFVLRNAALKSRQNSVLVTPY